MIIKKITCESIKIPLITPFKTSVRTAYNIEDLIIKISTDNGEFGIGSVPLTPMITGDSLISAKYIIEEIISKKLIGIDIFELDNIIKIIKNSVVHNTGAKAGVEIAIYDLYSKILNLPLYKILGGSRKKILTDITISVNDIDTMVNDSIKAVNKGFTILKIKVGNNYIEDVDRIIKIREAVGKNIILRVDINQGYDKKQAVKFIRILEDKNIDIELFEQPVKFDDLDGLKYVTDNVNSKILADESVFSIKDAVDIIVNNRADLINIKLMKTGGISTAIKIADLAYEYNVGCMMGCMLEGPIGIYAATHVACANSNIIYSDLDGLALAKENPFDGGIIQIKDELNLIEENYGLGIIIPEWVRNI